jgi:hypothetical protein
LRFLDRAVIDHLHEVNKIIAKSSGGSIREFDTVHALFPEGKELYTNAGFGEKTHVQIAVRLPEQIRGVFRIPAAELRDLDIPDLYNFEKSDPVLLSETQKSQRRKPLEFL